MINASEGASSFVITRTPMPRTPDDFEVSGRAVGGQWDWCWANAMPFRVLAAPRAGLPMPIAPRPNDDFMQHLGYWATLQYFLTYALGWSRHDKGLAWWYANGMPTLDRRLRLIAHVWGADGLLDRYFQWALTKGRHASPLGHHHIATGDDCVSVSPRFHRLLADAQAARNASDLTAQTPHGMHLENGEHISGPLQAGPKAKILLGSPHNSEAVLHQPEPFGWYRNLQSAGPALLAIPGADWSVSRVRVYVDAIGLVGTFRRSTESGLWFSGSHVVHMAGN